jgi:endonuclease/exonuclease/phosphatase family metal-dependent hydrolase
MLRRSLLVCMSWLLFVGCAPEQPPLGGDGGVVEDGGAPLGDAGPPDTGYPLPRDDLVPRIGRDEAIDMATWNLELFPLTEVTPEVVADLITSLGLDLVAVQEISDLAGFEELLDRLPYHSGALSSHEYPGGTYQKVGYVYRHDLLTVSDVSLLFSGAGYAFPRPPLQARLRVNGTDLDFTMINVHLKAGLSQDDKDRRSEAFVRLRDLMNQRMDGPSVGQVLLLGDFNETFTHPSGLNVMQPVIEDPRLRTRTRSLAEAGGVSFIPSSVMLDHIVTTSPLDEDFAGEEPRVPNLTAQLPSYRGTVSDHLPVVLSLPLP